MPVNHDERVEVVDGVHYRYRAAWTSSLESEVHWRLYWRQQKMMEKFVLPGDHVLEIGIGSGFTANYLRSKGIQVTTIDIDPEKKPDIVANIVNYNFDQNYDHILAFEVFEHLPFDEFVSLAKKLSRVCHKYLFLSVPRNEKILMKAVLKLPWLREFEFAIRRPRRKIVTEYHFWEVDHPLTPRKKIEETLLDAGFSIVRSELVFSRFFYTLKPRNFSVQETTV